mmetsp:Transcript_4537/g.7718  ORF Transcript_4537/g.7718 Transcript_4537/m.7718 type:complete len:270 (-) Transcript_4537:824-1633(-)
MVSWWPSPSPSPSSCSCVGWCWMGSGTRSSNRSSLKHTPMEQPMVACPIGAPTTLRRSLEPKYWLFSPFAPTSCLALRSCSSSQPSLISWASILRQAMTWALHMLSPSLPTRSRTYQPHPQIMSSTRSTATSSTVVATQRRGSGMGRITTTRHLPSSRACRWAAQQQPISRPIPRLHPTTRTRHTASKGVMRLHRQATFPTRAMQLWAPTMSPQQQARKAKVASSTSKDSTNNSRRTHHKLGMPWAGGCIRHTSKGTAPASGVDTRWVV